MRKMPRLLPLCLTLLLLAGCTATPPDKTGDTPIPDAPAAEDVTLYDCGGLQAAIPTKYVDLLLVRTDFSRTDPAAHGRPILSVRERASVEAFESDHSDYTIRSDYDVGYLFGISVLDQADFERYLQSENSGYHVFAADDQGYYYAQTTATDIQFYRPGGEIDRDSADWANWWEMLETIGDAVCADFLDRNGLTPYDENALANQDFTYEGGHAYVNYYPYFTFDGDKRIYDTLVLSQPVRQGDGGIWCVERVYDEYGRLYLNFPDSGMAAMDYYTQLQADHDAGKRSDLLTPLDAALVFGAEAAMVTDTPVPESFALTDGPDRDYMETNAEVEQLVLDLYFDRDVDPMALLDCAGRFTPDTWGVLGRRQYGSDWWSPLRAALESAAVGDGQADRDRNMCRLYLSAHGQFAEAVGIFLQTQQSADGAVFETVLAEFSPEEQTLLQTALNG